MHAPHAAILEALREARDQEEALARILLAFDVDARQLATLAPRLHPRTRGRLAHTVRTLIASLHLPLSVSGVSVQAPQECPTAPPADPTPPLDPVDVGRVTDAAERANVPVQDALRATFKRARPVAFIVDALERLATLRARGASFRGGPRVGALVLFRWAVKTGGLIRTGNDDPAAPARAGESTSRPAPSSTCPAPQREPVEAGSGLVGSRYRSSGKEFIVAFVRDGLAHLRERGSFVVSMAVDAASIAPGT